MTQALRYLFVVAGAVCSILLFLLASASDNSGFFDRYYAWLLGLNAAVAGAVCCPSPVTRLSPEPTHGLLSIVAMFSLACPGWWRR